MTTVPPSNADCLEIWDPQPPGNLWTNNGSVQELVYFYELTVHLS